MNSKSKNRGILYFNFIFCLLLVFTSSQSVFALADHIVLSEVVVDVAGPESAKEMVELYNPTGVTKDIGGWDIAYKTATGSSWSSKSTIPDGDTIPSYGYYLIGGDQLSPIPDHIDTSLGFSGSSGHVALRDGDNIIIDKLGYGSANDPEGSAAPSPGQDKSLERKPGESDETKGNGQDSDDNSSDFAVRNTPDPQVADTDVEIPDYDTGELTIFNGFTSLSDSTNIRLIDSDRNNKSTVAETVTVIITSNADNAGITLVLQEIDVDTEVFEADSAGQLLGICFTQSQQDTGKIQVNAVGDTITVHYADIAPYDTITKSVSYAGMLDIKINEIMFNPTGTDGGNEWVELYNSGSSSVDITGWTLTDEDAGSVMEMPSLTLPAGMFVVWYVDKNGTDDTDFSDSVVHIYSGETTTVSLTNTEDQVSLYVSTTRNSSTIVDFTAYCSDGYYSTPQDDDIAVAAGIWQSNVYVNTNNYAEGSSMCLKPDADDNDVPTDWEEDKSPTQGYSNSIIDPPSAPSSLLATAGNHRVDLSWTGSSKGDLDTAGYNIYRKLSGESYGSKLNDTYITVTEYTDTAVQNDSTYYYIVKAVDIGDNESDSSNEVSAKPTAPIPPGTNIVINEIMYDPAGSEPENEWVELYNPTDTTIEITGWLFSDGEGVYEITDTTVMAPLTFLVLGNTSGAAGGSVDLVYGSYCTGTISLSNGGDNVLIKDTENVIIDEVVYSDTWGGESPESLSRKYSGIESNDFTNWGKSQADGGTPGAANDVDTVAPTITHTPITAALAGKDIVIHFEAEDDLEWYSGKYPGLYYRRTGDTVYTYVGMYGIYDDYSGIIPGDTVTTDGIDYYVEIYDESNNKSTKPDENPVTSPYSINVIAGTYTIVINEIMYDPPTDEPEAEWIELYNYGDSTFDISGWILTDGEGSFTLPDTTIMVPGSYLVLGYSDSAAQGNVDVTYGDSMTGSIVLGNVFAGLGADEVIIKTGSGIIIDEVDYNVTWGAANGNGPNYLSLERLSPTGESNSGSNWSFSMDKYGTPGEANSLHLVWDVWAEPTLIDGESGETSEIRYRVSEPCTVTIKVYDENDNLIRTVVDGEYKSAADTYYSSWDGRDDTGNSVEGVYEFIITAEDTEDEVCTYRYNDEQLTSLYHGFTPDIYRNWANEHPVLNFYLSKPARVTVTIEESEFDKNIRTLFSDQAFGQGEAYYVWDARTDSGVKTPYPTTGIIEPTDIEGNIIVTRIPLVISTVQTNPVAYFDPENGETQAISYHINDTATVNIAIYDEYGVFIKEILSPTVQASGVQNISWDGKNESEEICSNSIYFFKIIATDDAETVIKFGDICIYNF